MVSRVNNVIRYSSNPELDTCVEAVKANFGVTWTVAQPSAVSAADVDAYALSYCEALIRENAKH
jgi:hypothetical protein